MTPVMFRFILFGIVVALGVAVTLHVFFRWVFPLLYKGKLEENKRYKQWCKLLKVKPKL